MQPLVLVILDGFGLSPVDSGNAVLNARTPNLDRLLSLYPHTLLHASGEEVGLEWGEMGNSEVGHLNLGTGRVILQDLARINSSIEDRSFFANQVLMDAFCDVVAKKTNLHIFGLCSRGGVHSSLDHLFALLDMAVKNGVREIYLHAVTDGRDTPPKVALKDLAEVESRLKQLGCGKIASVGGRYFGMDRDNRWDRVAKAYEAMFSEQAPKAKDWQSVIEAAYKSGKSDEFVEPVAIEATERIQEGDTIIFFNYRADRMKQISQTIINPNFQGFSRSKTIKKFNFISFTSYGNESSNQVKIAFFPQKVENQLAKIITTSGNKQLHIAETEKYAHVTYFFNGGVEAPFEKEERVMVASPKVATYDLKPEMSAKEVASKFLESYEKFKPLFTVINFANPDMVGHTGNYQATLTAVEVADQALGMVIEKVFLSQGNLVVTADHGNAEQMINPQTGEIDKEHTTNPVPMILATNSRKLATPIEVNKDYKITYATNEPIGVLADVTATIIANLGLSQPMEITGQNIGELIQ